MAAPAQHNAVVVDDLLRQLHELQVQVQAVPQLDCITCVEITGNSGADTQTKRRKLGSTQDSGHSTRGDEAIHKVALPGEVEDFETAQPGGQAIILQDQLAGLAACMHTGSELSPEQANDVRMQLNAGFTLQEQIAALQQELARGTSSPHPPQNPPDIHPGPDRQTPPTLVLGVENAHSTRCFGNLKLQSDIPDSGDDEKELATSRPRSSVVCLEWCVSMVVVFASGILVVLVLLLLVIVLLLTVPPIACYNELRAGCRGCKHHHTHRSVNVGNCNLHEQAYLESDCSNWPASARQTWTELESTDGAWLAHHIFVPCSAPLTPHARKSMLLVHGANSSAALTFASVAGRLSSSYDLYALDLPGFGRSTGPAELQTASVERVVQMYCDFFEQFCLATGDLQDLIVVGHSLGAFFMTRFAAIYPGKVQKLVLVNPAGILPVVGWWWALVFRLGLPSRPLRRSGIVSAFFFNHVVELLQAPPILCYWWQLTTSPGNCSDRIVARAVHVKRRACLKLHMIHLLLHLPIPVALIYGERDTLTPPDHGQLLAALAGEERLVHLIPGTGHLPMRKGDGTPFYEAICNALDAATVLQPPDGLEPWLRKSKTWEEFSQSPSARRSSSLRRLRSTVLEEAAQRCGPQEDLYVPVVVTAR